MPIKIALGSDHAGFEMKKLFMEVLKEKGFEIQDFGTFSDDSVDYPDYVHPVADGVQQGEYDFGVLACGSGNGVSMTANKHKGVRAAVCWSEDLAALSRQHNDANILCIPSRFISIELARNILESFLSAKFEGGRHERRVRKIDG